MSDLTKKKCESCEGGIPPLTKEEYSEYLDKVEEWEVVDGKQIEKRFTFENFGTALTFVNQVGKLAEKEGHHPDILLHGWNKVKIMLTTHAIGGLSENDFIMAAKIDTVTA